MTTTSSSISKRSVCAPKSPSDICSFTSKDNPSKTGVYSNIAPHSIREQHLRYPISTHSAPNLISSCLLKDLRNTMAAMDVWTCCSCGASNYDETAPDRCPICSHDRCDSCERGRPGLLLGLSQYSMSTDCQPRYIPDLSLTKNVYFGEGLDTGIDGVVSYGEHVSHGQHTQSYNNGEQYRYTEGVHSHGDYTHCPPDMTGWWVCCECGQANNPALAPSRCPYDGHVRSICCTTL